MGKGGENQPIPRPHMRRGREQVRGLSLPHLGMEGRHFVRVVGGDR